jgi:hypothetical protein
LVVRIIPSGKFQKLGRTPVFFFSFSFSHLLAIIPKENALRTPKPHVSLKMASATLAIDLVPAAAEDHPKSSTLFEDTDSSPTTSLSDNLIGPDQFGPNGKLINWNLELLSYYIGNNRSTLFNFAPTAFQNLLHHAAGDGFILRFSGK